MAKKEFILQGFTTRTHADAVRELFSIANIQRVILSVAFISDGGVEQIKENLATNAATLTVFAGIRNEITSHQALTKLLSLGGDLYAVDTGSRHVIFHPKLYMVRGNARARLIIGSANLTLGGLNNNIEAGMLLDFDMTNPADTAVADSIEAELFDLPHKYPSNVIGVTSTTILDTMLKDGRLIDEMAVPPPRPVTWVTGTVGDAVPRIKLKVPPLRRALAKATAPKKKPKPSSGTGSKAVPTEITATAGVEFELVWESKKLERRDLTIPKAAGTHATGSINLDKGLLAESVDHRAYFRNDVFPTLTWTSATKTTEEAFAKFHLVIKGVSYGEFDLRIGHTIGTTSKGYKQKNAMTRLSWGPTRIYIARSDLIGRRLSLYRDKADPSRFLLEID